MLYPYDLVWLSLRIILVAVGGYYFIRFFSNKLRQFVCSLAADATLGLFISHSVHFILLLALISILLGLIGVPTASLIALLGSAGLALSLAARDYLANVFGGIVIIAARYIKIGDEIEALSVRGQIKVITLFSTVIEDIKTGDRIYLPNSKLLSEKVVVCATSTSQSSS